MKLFVVCGRTHSGIDHAKAYLSRHKEACSIIDFADASANPEKASVMFAKLYAAEHLRKYGIDNKVLFIDTNKYVVLSEAIADARANNTPLDLVCQTFLNESDAYSYDKLKDAGAYLIPVDSYAEVGPKLLDAIMRFSMEVTIDEED